MNKSGFTVNRDKLEVIIERVFDAPRELVWKMFTDPSLIPQWWGPQGLETKVDKMDVKVGGIWRYVQTDQDGAVHAFNGVYKEIAPPEKMVSTFEYEPLAGHILTQTVVMEDRGGKTKVTSTADYANSEDLEGMVASGMEKGSTESWERLAGLVEKK